MARLFAIVLFCAGIFCIAHGNAQVPMTGAGLPKPGAAAGYTGPGDIVSGAVAWWGLRCYNAAYSGNVADITDSSTGSTTGTRLQCSAGTVSALVSGSACTFVTGNACSTLAVTCAVACNVEELYDQSGANSCTGSIPCSITISTNANRPTYVTSCSGLTSRPCMTFSGTQGGSSPNLISTVGQPGTISEVHDVSGTTVGGLVFTSECILLRSNIAQDLGNYCGATETHLAVPDGVWHTAQGVFNDPGSASLIYIDGGSGSASAVGNSVFLEASSVMGFGITPYGNFGGQRQ